MILKSIAKEVGLLWLSISIVEPSLSAQSRLPARLETYLTEVVKPTVKERAQLLAGQPIAKSLNANEEIEVAVFGAAWVIASIPDYIKAVRDIEHFENGKGFLVTQRISSPPTIQDFARMQVLPADLKDIRKCKVGSCNVKLSEPALKRFQTQVPWDSPNQQASGDNIMRQLSLEYVKGYLDGGNDRLAVYKDQERPIIVAREFRSLVDQLPAFTKFLPEVRNYLLGYPAVKLPNSTSFLYWQEVEFGLKPMTRISHLTIVDDPNETVVASKMLYANHYFWTALEVRVLVPDPSRGTGFWLFTVSRSRSDGLSGFLGRIRGLKIRSEAREGTLATLRATKTKLER